MRKEECVKLIDAGDVGRIAYNGADELVVIPVNYCYLNDLIIFRTAADSAVAQFDLAPIAFELDFTDEGLARRLERPGPRHGPPGHRAKRLDAARDRVEPWAGGTRESYMAIEPHRITGRRIRSW